MLRPAKVAQMGIPLAAVCAPFADGIGRRLPVVDPGPAGPLRCPRCQSFANPFFQWSTSHTVRFVCNMCGHLLEAPESLLEDLDRSGRCSDSRPHPELACGSVDLVAADRFDVGRVSEGGPILCIVLEASSETTRSGFYDSVLSCFARLFTCAVQRRVCLITFDTVLHFYMPSKSGRFRDVVMQDIDDPFLPAAPDAFLVREGLETLFTELREASSSETCAAGGAALQAAVELASKTGGGDVLMFQNSNTFGRSPSFFKDLLNLCVQGGVAVSSVASVPADAVEADTQWLAWRTGGDILRLPGFESSRHDELEHHMGHWLERMRSSAYSCVFKLRCSKGLEITSLVAPWTVDEQGEQNAFELPRISADMSFTFQLQTWDDQSVRDRQLYVQAVILYTNCSGKRLLRIHTVPINIVFSIAKVYQSASVAPIVAVLVKQAAVLALSGKSPKDFLLDTCLEVLATYRAHCSRDNGHGALLISKTLALLPLYVLAARKLMYNLTSSKAPDMNESLMRLLRMPIHGILALLYPRIYVLPADSSDQFSLCPCLKEHVAEGPSQAYIITNGMGSWLWAAGEVDKRPGQLLIGKLRAALEPSASCMLDTLPNLNVAEASWAEKIHLGTLFVEDEGAMDMSYKDWVQYLQQEVLHWFEG